jgi:hypothetical protein
MLYPVMTEEENKTEAKEILQLVIIGNQQQALTKKLQNCFPQWGIRPKKLDNDFLQ